MASASTSTTNPVADVRPEAAGEEVSLKRKKNEAEWKKNVAKARKNSGKEYISRSTGKVMAARRVRDPCGCPKSCFDKLGEEAVRSIFTEYWNIGEFNAQSAYLLTRVKSKEVKKRRVAAEGSRRSATLEYTVHVGERNVVVCKKAFLNIHDIGDRRVLNVLKKTGDTGVAPVGRRGSHGHTHNKPAEDVKQLGHDHIKSLPLCSSHYSRAKSRHRLYLPPGYTQQHCYSLFQLWCEGKDVPADKVMNFDAYRRMFTTYNIGRRKHGVVNDTEPGAEPEEPVAKKGKQRRATKDKGVGGSQVATKATRGKKKEQVEVKEEQMDVKEEPEEREEEAGVAEKVTKPRGRPKKPKQEIKEELEEDEDDLPLNVIKGRGGASAKTKQAVQTEEEETPPQTKKGRKRAAAKPKVEVLDEEEETAPLIKRGKRGAAAVKPKQDIIDEEDIEDAALLIKKGKRGAAAKPKSGAADEEEEEATPPVKKGRKRAAAAKPKQKAVNQVDDATFVISKEEDKDEQSPPSTSAGKKKSSTAAKAAGGKAKPKAVKKEAVSKTTPAGGKENTDTSNLLKKSGVKTGVERKVVVKGRAAVDALCPIAQNSHVFEEDYDDIWDCMLNQTNIQFNNNKFYLIQLLEDDSSKTYSVWMRWGRVGANGQVSLVPCGSDLEKAKKVFMKKFSDKTRNEWDERFMFEKVPGKYDLLKMDYSKGKDTPDSAAVVKKAKERAAIECKLHPRVRVIIELICDVKCMEEAVVEMKYDANKAPLGKLTSEQIKAGYLALKRIDSLIESEKFVMKDLVQACNDFYTRVPHYFGMKVPPLIRTKAEIREKVALLEALGDIQAALSVLDQPIDVNTHPSDHHYRNLKCDMTPLEKDSEDYKIIENYLRTTHAKTHSQYKLELLEVLACRKESEYQRFKDLGNSMLLWHGSRMSNWAGILSQGLRIAPPEAPVTGYMFGKGIYFADMASKSANYCWASAQKNVGFLMLSEVALGKSNELLQADYNANNLPKGCHSVKGCGRTAPQPENFTKLSDGTVVPMGPGVEVAPKNNLNYSLLYNEYIVYDPAQVRTRFLLKVKFNFK